MQTRKGSELTREDQQYVLRAYVHRFTAQHRPQWALEKRPDGTTYPVQFASDADWLAHTEFYVTKSGRLDKRRHHCFSSPTWPNNPELRTRDLIVS